MLNDLFVFVRKALSHYLWNLVGIMAWNYVYIYHDGCDGGDDEARESKSIPWHRRNNTQ
jgi:hypothetical protein